MPLERVDERGLFLVEGVRGEGDYVEGTTAFHDHVDVVVDGGVYCSLDGFYGDVDYCLGCLFLFVVHGALCFKGASHAVG